MDVLSFYKDNGSLSPQDEDYLMNYFMNNNVSEEEATLITASRSMYNMTKYRNELDGVKGGRQIYSPYSLTPVVNDDGSTSTESVIALRKLAAKNGNIKRKERESKTIRSTIKDAKKELRRDMRRSDEKIIKGVKGGIKKVSSTIKKADRKVAIGEKKFKKKVSGAKKKFKKSIKKLFH